MQILPVSGALGAEITGLNLTRPFSGAEERDFKQALLDYEVLFFRDQAMTPADHARLADYLGKPQLHEAYSHVEGYPQLVILESTREKPSLIEEWHTDMTFRPCPPLGSILHGRIIPPKGGDTLFASMSAAYKGLSKPIRQLLSGLRAVHDFRRGFRHSLAEPGGQERLAKMLADNPPVTHPVVRVHPESGRRGLFVNQLFTTHICDLSARESEALLTMLYQHLTSPEFCCRFRWQPDSVAIWDNRITQHKPVNDFGPLHRKMQRITVDDGNVPKGPCD